MNLTKTPLLLMLIMFFITFQTQIRTSDSQQQYIDNLQMNCSNNDNRTYGFICDINGKHPSCISYLTFRSNPPLYSTPRSIASLLNANPSDIARLNNVSESTTILAGQMVVVPVECNCTRAGLYSYYYQHNASYELKEIGETYMIMANNTYQGLTTCQAMMAQNPLEKADSLHVGDEFRVPLRCACPTDEQERKYGARFLLYYGLVFGEDVSQVAEMFGVDLESVLDANELSVDSTVYPFSPILVPLQSVPINVNFSLPPSIPSPQPNPTPSGTGSSSKKSVYIGVGIGAGILVLVLSSIFIWFIFLRPTKRPASTVINEKGMKKDPESESTEYATLPSSYNSSQNPKSSSVTLHGFISAIDSLTAYKFTDLVKATGMFSQENRIRGSVFRGEFNGDKAAIKILKGRVASDEINLLKHINHSNIIRLSGYCIHEGNTYLVYEFAEKGSLDIWIHGNYNQQSKENSVSLHVLDWKQRVQIAFDIAEALNYLHSYVNPPHIHKNIKSSNIVLDANYRAKISNFGLARTVENTNENGELHLTKHVIGTHGYLAPEYIEHGVVTPKLDVFAFGVVLLELLSGEPAVILSETDSSNSLLSGLIREVIEGGNVREELMDFMDFNLSGEYTLDSAYSMAQLGYKCVDQDMNSRPSMSEVSMTLSKICSSLEF